MIDLNKCGNCHSTSNLRYFISHYKTFFNKIYVICGECIRSDYEYFEHVHTDLELSEVTHKEAIVHDVITI